MKKVTCDVCAAPVGAVGFAVVWAGNDAHEAGDGYRIVGDYCSAACIVRALNAVGVKRPDFDAGHALLAERAQMDEDAMLGAFDDVDPAIVEASLPYTPPAPFNGARRNHALASADAAAVLGR